MGSRRDLGRPTPLQLPPSLASSCVPCPIQPTPHTAAASSFFDDLSALRIFGPLPSLLATQPEPPTQSTFATRFSIRTARTLDGLRSCGHQRNSVCRSLLRYGRVSEVSFRPACSHLPRFSTAHANSTRWPRSCACRAVGDKSNTSSRNSVECLA